MRKALVVTVLLMTAMWLMAQAAPQHPSSVDGAGVSLPSGLVYWDLKVGTGATAAKAKR